MTSCEILIYSCTGCVNDRDLHKRIVVVTYLCLQLSSQIFYVSLLIGSNAVARLIAINRECSENIVDKVNILEEIKMFTHKHTIHPDSAHKFVSK